MKTLLATVSLSLALAGASSAGAQVFRPSVGSGAVVGAVAGGLIGGHNGDRWAEGAIIGGVAGALIGAAMTPQERVYQPVPVYQGSPQVVYGQPGTVVSSAPTIPDAPVVPNAPVVVQAAPQVVYAQPAPQVVYVEPQPRVVYVEPAPRVVYVERPAIRFGFGYYSGPRYYGRTHHHGHSHRSHGHRHRGRH